MKEGERAPVDLNDLISDLDSENTTVINNEEEAREVTQNLANALAQLALSNRETLPQTTAEAAIQPTSEIDSKQGEGKTTEAGAISQDVTPIPTKATISPEQIKHATVSIVLLLFLKSLQR